MEKQIEDCYKTYDINNIRTLMMLLLRKNMNKDSNGLGQSKRTGRTAVSKQNIALLAKDCKILLYLSRHPGRIATVKTATVIIATSK